MSNYTNTFGGAAKDAAESIIQGTDFDTEFDNIATMSGTKANKAVPASTDNVATLSASGDLQDGGFKPTTYVKTILDDTDAGAVKDTLLLDTSVTITPSSDADVTLSSTQATYGRLILVDGSWTSAHNIIVPTNQRSYWVDNSAGTYTATVKTSAGTGIAVTAGTSRPLVCDGTNVIDPMTAFRGLGLGYISGFVCTNNAADANNDIDISVGECRDSTNSVNIIGSAMTKRLDAAWAAGTGNGGLDTGSKAVSTEYYLHAIRKDSDASVDYLFSTSRTAPTMPTGYTKFRNVGWCKTDSSGNILGVVVNELSGGGVSVRYNSKILDVNLTNTLTTSSRLDALSVPTGIKVRPIAIALTRDANGHAELYTDPDEADTSVAIDVVYSTQGAGAENVIFNLSTIYTDTSRRIRARSSLATVDLYQVMTHGFEWSRR